MLMRQKVLLILALLLMEVTGAWAQTGSVTLASGTEDAANWTIAPNDGVTTGSQVSIAYNGNLKVNSLTAAETYIDNMLGNGSFDANTDVWYGWGSTQSWDATGGTDGSGAVKIEVTNAGNIWDATFAQSLTTLEAGKTYLLRFKVRASGTGHVQYCVQQPSDPYPSAFVAANEVGTSWITVERVFTVPSDGNSYSQLCLQTGADANVTYWIDDVVLGEVKHRAVTVTETETGRQWTLTMPENNVTLQVAYAPAYRVSFTGTNFVASEWALAAANGTPITSGLVNPAAQVTIFNNGNRTLNSFAVVEKYTDNVLSNGTFDAGIDGWFGWGATQSWDATGGTDGSGAVKIEVTTAGNIWDAVTAQDLSAALEAGKTYMLRFKIRSSGTGRVMSLVQQPTGSYPAVGNLTKDVGTSWTTIEMPMTVTADGNSYTRLCFQTGANANTTYWIDDVELGEVKERNVALTEVEAGKRWTFTMPANNVVVRMECEKGYDATFIAANASTIEDGAAAVAVDGIAATLTNGKLSAVSAGRTVTVTAQEGFEFDTVALTVETYTPLCNATAADYGKVVCDEGHLHSAKTAVPTGCTAVGILGKVTASGHGLILALQDAPMQIWSTINSWESVTTYAGTSLKVLPNDAARGNLTSYTTLGTTPVSNWAVGLYTDYSTIFTNLGSTKSDAKGTTYDANVNSYITTGVGGSALSGIYMFYISQGGAGNFYEEGFLSSDWDSPSYSPFAPIRPVLGF